MKNFLFLVVFSLVVLTLPSCVSIHSVGIGQMEPTSGTQQVVQAEAMGILMVTVPDMNELENRAVNELKSQGTLRNVRVRLEMRNFFVIQLYKIVAIGER